MMLDDISWLILEELQRNGRITYKDLGEKVGLTAPAVADRVRRLQSDGVISGFSAVVNPAVLGLPLLAVIRVRGRGDSERMIDEVARDLPEVLECHRVTGSESHVIRAAVSSPAHLEALLERIRPYGDTITNLVTSSSVTRRVLTRQITE